MSRPGTSALLADLRRRISELERPFARAGGVLPFGIAAIDARLPEGGLARGALHEVAGGGVDAMPAAAAAAFTAGILARLENPVLWCTTSADLFAPGLACAGLHPNRVLHAQAPDDRTVLLVMEEALRHASLAAVVGEVARLPMTASRRLVLAAEKSGVMAVALHRRRERMADEAGLTAAATRWQVTPLPCSPPPSERPASLPGIGRARWRIELTRNRGGSPYTLIMEACDAQGRLAVPAASAGGTIDHGEVAAGDSRAA